MIGCALLHAGFIGPENLWVSGRSERRGAFEPWPSVTVTNDNEALGAACDTILLPVPPDAFHKVRVEARDRLVIPVMAGLRAADIAAATGADRVVRALPNAAAELARSFTPWWAATGKARELGRGTGQGWHAGGPQTLLPSFDTKSIS